MPLVVGAGDARLEIADLFRAHYADLVRLAVLLVGDIARAEEVVQDAFLGLHRRRAPLDHPDRVVGYLRRSVVNGARSFHRRRRVAERHLAAAAVEFGADVEALRRVQAAAIVDAVRELPARQRECIVLRHYAGLTDVEIADAIGVSVGSVKTHLHRARAALATALSEEV